jgi:hypothetical protein
MMFPLLMMTEHHGVKYAKKNADSNLESTVTDFGNRKISAQNFSKIVALPKTALISCGNPRKVNVKLVESNGKKCIMLTPVPKTPEEEIEDKMLGANTL